MWLHPTYALMFYLYWWKDQRSEWKRPSLDDHHEKLRRKTNNLIKYQWHLWGADFLTQWKDDVHTFILAVNLGLYDLQY